MKETKYHHGDRVLIVPELTRSMPKMMSMYCDHIMTVDTVLHGFNSGIYRMAEDHGMWYWRDEDIVGRVVKKKVYEIGDVVLAKVTGWHNIKMRTVKAVLRLGGVLYQYEDEDGDPRCSHREIEGCLEPPEESATEHDTVPDLSRSWEEVITIRSDGTHTDASLTRVGAKPVSYDVSLRRDSRDAHDLHAAAKLALDKLKEKDRQKDLPPLYTGDVFCVDSRPVSQLYTTGKIYSIKDGVLTADDGEPLSGIRSFQWLEKKSAAKWMEVVK